MSQKKITVDKNKLKNEKQQEKSYNQDVAQNKLERKNNETLFHYLQRRTSFSLAKKVTENKRNASFHNGSSNDRLNKSNVIMSESVINSQQDYLSQSKKKKIQFKDNNKDQRDDQWDQQHDRLNNYSLDLIPITPTKLKDFLRSPSNNVSENIEVLQQSSAKKSILGNSVILFKNHLQQNNPSQKGILSDLNTNNNSLEIDDLFSSSKQTTANDRFGNQYNLTNSFYEANQYIKSSRNDIDSSKKRDQSEDNMKKSILKKQKSYQKNDMSYDDKENSISDILYKERNSKNNQPNITNRSYVKQQINILKEKSNLDFNSLKQNFSEDIEIGEKQVKSQIQKLMNFVIQNSAQIDQVKQKIEDTQDSFSSIDRHILNNYQFFQDVPHFIEKFKALKNNIAIQNNFAKNMDFNREHLEQQIGFFQSAFTKQIENAIKDLQTKKIKQNRTEIENLEKQIKDIIIKNDYLTQENKMLKNNNNTNSLQNTTIDLNLSQKKNNNNSMIFIGDDIQSANCDYLLKKENKKLQSKVEELMNEIHETSKINENIQQNMQHQVMRSEAEILELRQENQQFIKDLQQIETEYSKKVSHLEQQLKNLSRLSQDRDDRNYHVSPHITNENLFNQIKVLNNTLEDKEKLRLKQKSDFEYASDIMTQEIVKLKKEIKYLIMEKESIQRKYSELIGQTKQLEAYVNQNEQLIRQLQQREEDIDNLITIIKEVYLLKLFLNLINKILLISFKIKVKSKEMGFERYLKCYFKKANINDHGSQNDKKPFKI